MNMQLPSRSYYYLDELAAAWKVQIRDLLDFAVCDALQCSVLVQNTRVVIPTDDERGEELCLNGLAKIVPDDLIEVIRAGVGSIRRFRHESAAVLMFADGQADLAVAVEHVLVSREDRTRFEDKARGEAPQEIAAPPSLQHRSDFSEVTLAGQTFTFGPAQAGVVRRLHEAHVQGQPWCSTADLLKGTGTARLVDLFKRKKAPSWRLLIVSDNRGKWRLNISAAEQLATNRAYRRVTRMFRRMNATSFVIPPRPISGHP